MGLRHFDDPLKPCRHRDASEPRYGLIGRLQKPILGVLRAQFWPDRNTVSAGKKKHTPHFAVDTSLDLRHISVTGANRRPDPTIITGDDDDD